MSVRDYLVARTPELLKYLGVLLLFAGLFFLVRGVFSAVAPPVEVARVTLSVYFEYDGDIVDFLSGTAVDRFRLTDVRFGTITVGLYDSGSAPDLGVQSSWPECSDGLVLTVQLDNKPYGPFCHQPGLLSSSFWTGETGVDFIIYTTPGPHTLKIIASYNGVPVAEKTITFRVKSYDEVVSAQ